MVLPEADEATILTVWLPLTDATVRERLHAGDPAQPPRGAEGPLPGRSASDSGRAAAAGAGDAAADEGRQRPADEPADDPLVDWTTSPRTRSGSASTCAISRSGSRPDARGSPGSWLGVGHAPSRRSNDPSGLGEALAGHPRDAGPRRGHGVQSLERGLAGLRLTSNNPHARTSLTGTRAQCNCAPTGSNPVGARFIAPPAVRGLSCPAATGMCRAGGRPVTRSGV